MKISKNSLKKSNNGNAISFSYLQGGAEKFLACSKICDSTWGNV